MRHNELAWLADTAAQLKPGAIWLEIGTWFGRSWTCVALSLPADSTMVAVDTFRGEVAEPLKYVTQHGPVLEPFIQAHESLRRHRADLRSAVFAMHSSDAARLVLDGVCDVIFVDGDHRTEQVIDDITAWRVKLKPAGLMCGHDGDDPAVIEALKGLAYSMDPSLRGSIWVLHDLF